MHQQSRLKTSQGTKHIAKGCRAQYCFESSIRVFGRNTVQGLSSATKYALSVFHIHPQSYSTAIICLYTASCEISKFITSANFHTFECIYTTTIYEKPTITNTNVRVSPASDFHSELYPAANCEFLATAFSTT